jgi:hypothetical protein
MKKLLLLLSAAVLASGCDDGPTNDGSGGSHGSTSATASGPGTTGSMSGSTGAASGTSNGASTGSSAGGCASYALCEEFESGSPGETPTGWTEHAGWDQGGSRAVLSTEEKHGGAQSLKSAVGTNGQFRVERDLSSLGELATHHWGRIFYKVKTPVSMDNQYIHNTLVAFGHPDLGNGGESRLLDTVMAPDGTHQFLFNVPDDSCCKSSSYNFKYDDKWHCAEWYVEGATETFQFFYDGAEVKDIAFTGIAGAHIADFKSIIVGWINYQSPSKDNEGWFDDLAIDDQRIGCN